MIRSLILSELHRSPLRFCAAVLAIPVFLVLAWAGIVIFLVAFS